LIAGVWGRCNLLAGPAFCRNIWASSIQYQESQFNYWSLHRSSIDSIDFGLLAHSSRDRTFSAVDEFKRNLYTYRNLRQYTPSSYRGLPGRLYIAVDRQDWASAYNLFQQVARLNRSRLICFYYMGRSPAQSKEIRSGHRVLYNSGSSGRSRFCTGLSRPGPGKGLQKAPEIYLQLKIELKQGNR